MTDIRQQIQILFLEFASGKRPCESPHRRFKDQLIKHLTEDTNRSGQLGDRTCRTGEEQSMKKKKETENNLRKNQKTNRRNEKKKQSPRPTSYQALSADMSSDPTYDSFHTDRKVDEQTKTGIPQLLQLM